MIKDFEKHEFEAGDNRREKCCENFSIPFFMLITKNFAFGQNNNCMTS